MADEIKITQKDLEEWVNMDTQLDFWKKVKERLTKLFKENKHNVEPGKLALIVLTQDSSSVKYAEAVKEFKTLHPEFTAELEGLVSKHTKPAPKTNIAVEEVKTAEKA